jgi:hypothetical protein
VYQQFREAQGAHGNRAMREKVLLSFYYRLCNANGIERWRIS